MAFFKKLQENSLYWRYRFISRRYLAIKRWWRELRSPRPRTIKAANRFRGMAAANPYGRGAGLGDSRRGMLFVLALVAAWTALSLLTVHVPSLLLLVLRVGSLALITYCFVRFW